MNSDSAVRRFLVAVADAAPAFTPVARPVEGGFGRRLLLAFSDSAPAFTPLARLIPLAPSKVANDSAPESRTADGNQRTRDSTRQATNRVDSRATSQLATPLPTLVIFVCSLVLVEATLLSAVIPLLPHYVHAVGLSKAGAGILVAAYPAGTLVGSVLDLFLFNRIDSRKVVLLGLMLFIPATLAFGWESSAWVLYVARFGQGIAGTWTWRAGLAWLTNNVSDARRGRVFAQLFGFATAGTLLGPVVGGVANQVGTRPVFTVASAIGAVLMFTTLAMASPSVHPRQRMRLRWGMRSLRIRVGLWLTALAGAAFGIVGVLAPLRLNHLGASGTVVAGIFLGSAAIQAVLPLLAGRLTDRYGALLPVVSALAIGAVFSGLVPRPSTVPLLAIILVLGLPFFGVLHASANAITAEGVRSLAPDASGAFALINLTWAGAQAFGASLGGLLAQDTSDVVPYFLLAVACGMAIAAFLIRPSLLGGPHDPNS